MSSAFQLDVRENLLHFAFGDDSSVLAALEIGMSKQRSFWQLEDRLNEISATGDPLETLSAAVDFERFRPIIQTPAGRPPGGKGGRPALDTVLKFNMLLLLLQSLHGLRILPTNKSTS